jgi:hypothetical protein
MSLINRFFGKRPETQAATSNAVPEVNLKSKPLPEAVGSVSKQTSLNQGQINPESSAASPTTRNLKSYTHEYT